MTIIISFLS